MHWLHPKLHKTARGLIVVLFFIVQRFQPNWEQPDVEQECDTGENWNKPDQCVLERLHSDWDSWSLWVGAKRDSPRVHSLPELQNGALLGTGEKYEDKKPDYGLD